MNESIMFTHNDLDGIGCGILHKAGYGRNAETHYCGYHNVDEKITDFIKSTLNQKDELPMLIISDLGISRETAELVDRYEGKKVLLDHHASNMWLKEKYEWAIVDVEASGTLLVFNFFENEVPRKYADFALHVDDYDRWIHSMPKSIELNRLYYIIGISRFEERFLSGDVAVEFTESEKLLLELEDEAVGNYSHKVEKGLTVYTMAGDKRLGIGFADRYQSEVAHDIIDRLELDAIALFDVNFRKVSLRSKPNFDVGSIAERLGGGGHKNAAGIEFNYGRIADFQGHKYPLFDVHENFKNMIFSMFWKISRTFEAIETEEISQHFQG